MRYIFVWAATVVSASVFAFAGTPVHWLSPIDGSWEDQNAWLEGRVPNQAGDDPTLNLVGAYTVYSEMDALYGSLIIENPLVVLQLYNANHTLLSNIHNSGRVILGSPMIPARSSILLGGFNTIVGSGIIELASHSPTNRSKIDAGFSVFTQETDHSIIGSGELFVTGMTNKGTIEAQGSIGLRLFGSYSQTSTGRIGANSSSISLAEGAAIDGGDLYTTESGEINIEGSIIELSNISTNATLSLMNGAQQINLGGEIVNNGQFLIDATVDHDPKVLHIYTDSAISGDGTIRLSTDGDSSEAVLDIKPNRTVSIENDIQTSGLILGTPESLIQFSGQITSIPGQSRPVIRCPITGPAELTADLTDIELRSPTTLTDFTLRGLDGAEFVLGTGTVTLDNCVNTSTIRFDQVASRLDIRNNFVNNGIIKIDARNIVSEPVVNSVGGSTLSGVGSIELISREGIDAVLAGGSNTLTIGSGQTVFGSGFIRSDPNGGNVINQGTIRATVPEYPINLRGNHQGDNGAYIADGADIELVYPVYIQSAKFQCLGDGEILAKRSTFESCTLESGKLRIQQLSSNAVFEGDMINHGSIHVERDAELTLAGNSTLSGPGEILLESNAELILGTFSDFDPPVIYEGQSITGSGFIRGTGTFQSASIIATDPDRTMYVSGILTFENGNIISGNGLVSLSGGSIISGAQLSGDNIDTNTIGSSISLENCDIRTHLSVHGGVKLLNETQNNGTIQLKSGVSSSSPRFLQLDPFGIPVEGTGVIKLENQLDHSLGSVTIRSTVNQTGRIGSGQRVIGGGQIIGRIELYGELAPSGPRAEFQVTELILETGSILTTTLSPTTSDELSSYVSILPEGSLEVHGTLRIELTPGFVPEPGFSHQIVRSYSSKVPGVIIGEFESIQLPEAPEGIRYVVEQSEDELVLIVACFADFNADFELDIFDISIFMQGIQMQDPISDLNEDGRYDFFDISYFIHEFSQGCK